MCLTLRLEFCAQKPIGNRNMTALSRKWLYAIPALLIIGLAWYFKVIVAYLLVAAVLSLIGQPVIGFLTGLRIRERSIPPALAAMLTLLSILGTLLAVVAMFIPLVVREAKRLSNTDPEEVINGFRAPLHSAQAFIDRFSMGSDPVKLESVLIERLSGLLDVNAITTSLNYAVGLTGDVLLGFFAICFITFFFLKDRQLLRSMLMTLVPDAHEERLGKVLSQSKQLLTRYFIGILVEMAIVMAVIAIGLSVLGIRNAILIGFVGGLFNVIPYVGPLIGAALGIIIGIATNSDSLATSGILALVGKMSIVYACAQLLDNIVLQPMIYSRSVKAHPLEIFLIIIMAGNVGGIVGMIVAIPTYSIFRVFAGEFLTQFKIVRGLTEQRD